MKTTDLTLHCGKPYEQILPFLLKRVFHVTRLSVLEQLLHSGEIKANVDGQLPTMFGSSNSFFRKRGCVSVFDYRSASAEQIHESIGKCSPLQALSRDAGLAFLFLSDSDHHRFRHWTEWKEEQAWREKIVPYVEAGYPGPIPITSIEEVFRVTTDCPPDPIVEALQKGRLRAK